MNVVLVGIALWAVLDGLLLSQLRTQPRSAHRVLLILEVVLAVLAVAALLADEPVRSVSFWSVGVLLNTALAAVGLPRRRIFGRDRDWIHAHSSRAAGVALLRELASDRSREGDQRRVMPAVPTLARCPASAFVGLGAQTR